MFIFLAVFKRTFCDNDVAIVSCPDDKQLVFHENPFYGRTNFTAESCRTTSAKTCTSNIYYSDLVSFCDRSSCRIEPVSYEKLGQDECEGSDNYLTLYHSCQESKYITVKFGRNEDAG